MKDETKAATELVDALLYDLDGRSGFDTGMIDKETMAEWRAKWVELTLKAMQEVAK